MKAQFNLMWGKNTNIEGVIIEYFTQVGQGSDKFLKTLSVQNVVTKNTPLWNNLETILCSRMHQHLKQHL